MNKQTQQTMFSSKTPEWETPQSFFEKLDERWSFTLDPCSTEKTAKCKTFFTEKDNGLEMDWKGHRAFVNPPYGRSIRLWVEKAYREALKQDTVVVCLLPARTDTRWFHDYCMKAQVIKFVKGRLKFGEATTGAPFPSMIVVFNGRESATLYGTPVVHTLTR